jgi:cytochrome c1
MSLLAKARKGGANYIYGILTGYEEPPEGTTLLQGQHWNATMPGHVIAMAPPLTDGQIAYDDNAPQTVDQYARDVSTFLTWAAEPHMEDRKRTGIKVFLFMLALTVVMYRVKKKVWSKVH